MAQHDGVIDNGSGLAVRTDINALASALITSNSGATAPSPTYANMIWADTSASPVVTLKQRNNANSGWITLGSYDGTTYTPSIPTSTVTTAMMAAIAANTVIANNTGSSASPAAVALSNNELLGRGGSNITAINAGLLRTNFMNFPRLKFGYTLANNATDANNDIDFGPGVAAADNVSGTPIIYSNSTITKRLDASFATGTGNGGLDTGSKANNTWYHCYVVQNPSTGANDRCFSTSASGPGGAVTSAGFTNFRRVGSVLTDSSGNIKAFFQFGDDFFWVDTTLDFNLTTISTSGALVTVSTPLGVATIAKHYWWLNSNGNNNFILVYSPNETNSAPVSTNHRISVGGTNPLGANLYSEVLTNLSSQIGCRGSFNAAAGYYGRCAGWREQF